MKICVIYIRLIFSLYIFYVRDVILFSRGPDTHLMFFVIDLLYFKSQLCQIIITREILNIMHHFDGL